MTAEPVGQGKWKTKYLEQTSAPSASVLLLLSAGYIIILTSNYAALTARFCQTEVLGNYKDELSGIVGEQRNNMKPITNVQVVQKYCRVGFPYRRNSH